MGILGDQSKKIHKKCNELAKIRYFEFAIKKTNIFFASNKNKQAVHKRSHLFMNFDD